MKIQCKFCRIRMEPRIEIDQRNVTTDQKTYYCSLCGKQLLVLGGFWQKPFWKQPGYIGLWMPSIILDLIDLWEKFKTGLKEKAYQKLFFIGLLIISSIISLFFYFPENVWPR